MHIEKTETTVRVFKEDGTKMLDTTVENPPPGWPDGLLKSFIFVENGVRLRWDVATQTFIPFVAPDGTPADAPLPPPNPFAS